MAWIESHQDLATNPKAKRAARLLDVTLPQVVGHLHMLWWWALDHAFDGDISSFDALDLADAAGWDGDPETFVAALVDCGPGDKDGFIEPEMRLHDWLEFTKHLRAARKASLAGNHKRHHVDKGVVSPDCTLCDSQTAPMGVPRDDVGTPDPSGCDSTGTGTDRNPPTEPEPTGTRTSPPDGGDPDDEPDVSDDARSLTRQFAIAVKGNGHSVPTARSKQRRDWLIEMDRLLRIGPPGEGGIVPDPSEVATVIAWCAADCGDDRYPGESVNVRSVPKFRARYSQLRLKAINGQRAGPALRAVGSHQHADGNF